MSDEKKPTFSKRLFINDVDKYSSKYIAKFLASCHEQTEEEEEEEAGGGEEEDSSDYFQGKPVFQIVGTTSSKDGKDGFLLEQYTSPSRDELLAHLLQCDVVVYNISEDATQEQVEEATWAITALHAELENFKSRKLFVLVSTVMTWAMTKPQNPDNPDALLTEEEYIRRRPHPKFTNHINVEKLVLKLGRTKRSKLSAYVVAAGLQYGKGENLFHYFFKVSWLMQLPEVPLFGEATNYIPMIHVCDLAGIILNIIKLTPKSKYILAVDESHKTLEDIVMEISHALGPGKVVKVPEQEAITMKAFEPEELPYLSINLRLEAFIIKDFSLQWKSEAGMAENIEHIVEEYKDTRQLLPIRICLVGPPAVGKTTIAEKLCSHYQIHHIKINKVIKDKMAQLRQTVNGAETEYNSDEVAAAQQQLETFKESVETNGQLADELFFDILHEKLNSRPCWNQGYVLDGLPETHESENMTDNITPEHVFCLNATDDFLMKRVHEPPHSEAKDMHYTEEEFVPRLKRYRELIATKGSMLGFFDDLDIYTQHIEVTTAGSEYEDVMKKITAMVGTPKNYGLSPEEQEVEDRKKEEEQRQNVAVEAAERKRRNEAALAEMVARYEELQRNLAEVQRDEPQLLACSLPMRNYLMKEVMPALIKALVDCCRIKPEDPVDFVAQHLIRNSPFENEGGTVTKHVLL